MHSTEGHLVVAAITTITTTTTINNFVLGTSFLELHQVRLGRQT